MRKLRERSGESTPTASCLFLSLWVQHGGEVRCLIAQHGRGEERGRSPSKHQHVDHVPECTRHAFENFVSSSVPFQKLVKRRFKAELMEIDLSLPVLYY